jgi:flagellar hook-associated protein 1 FlgK
MVDILGIGTSGLTAYRKLLETVGGNITNANTEGYLRRDVMLSGAGDSSMLPTAAPSASGSGVTVDTVRRANDAFLQIQSLKANSLNLQTQTLADSLTTI